jgi:hypothetical protein
LALYVNYGLNFNDLVLRSQTGFTKLFFYFLFYALAYYITLLPVYSTKTNNFFSRKDFWITTIVGLVALSLDSSVPYLRDGVELFFEPALQFWAYKVTVNLISFFTIILPLLIFYWSRKKSAHYYGLQARRFDPKPYFYMLLIMLPIMVAASFHPSFIRQYPMYKPTEAYILLDVPEWVTILIYEIAYGLDFLTVEFLFRGFFVIGMIHILGRHSVLAMAAIYCFLHMGKPMGEAISSIFGGYILGVVAYETKSIWGGVIVHLGIAWMMEIIGFLQRGNTNLDL